MKKTIHLNVARNISNLLDNKFNIFGIKFGLDPILGLIPGIGDFLPLVLGGYMVWIAKEAKVPNEKIAEMIRNIMIDAFLGLIPVIGDVSDFVFRAYHKNMKILDEYGKDISYEIEEGEIIK